MLKLRSLGSVITGASRGLLLTAATNATPIVATFAGGSAANTQHGLKTNDRIGIFGVTVNTAANGIWTLLGMEYSGQTATLKGSKGNGASTLTTSVVAIVNDKTPFMRGHSALLSMTTRDGSAAFQGTAKIMGSKDVTSTTLDASILASDNSTLATYFEDVYTADLEINGQAIPAPGASTSLTALRECKLRRWMYLDATTVTAGGVQAAIVA